MAAVLAWIVAVERHQPRAGRPSPLDFPAAISRRALEWAEWLATRAGTRLLLNVNAAPGSPEHQRVQALQAQVLNPADAHRADARALHRSTRSSACPPPTRTSCWCCGSAMA